MLTSITQRHSPSEMLSVPPLEITPRCCRPRELSRRPQTTSWPRGPRCRDRQRHRLRRAHPDQCPSSFQRRLPAESASISASITCMPASANARPSASPMPLAPPVTNAVLPASSRTFCFSFPPAGRMQPQISRREVVEQRVLLSPQRVTMKSQLPKIEKVTRKRIRGKSLDLASHRLMFVSCCVGGC